MSFPEAARIQPIKKSLSVKAKRMAAVTMALPQENKKTRGRLKQSGGEDGNGDEGKAEGYRAGGVVAMASSARRRKTAWARTVRAATHSSCRCVAWSPSPSAPSRAAAALEILRRKPAAFGSQASVVSATRWSLCGNTTVPGQREVCDHQVGRSS